APQSRRLAGQALLHAQRGGADAGEDRHHARHCRARGRPQVARRRGPQRLHRGPRLPSHFVSRTPGPPQQDSAPQSADDRLREQGLQLVTLLSAVIRIGRAYSVTNQVFRAQVDSIATSLNTLLAHAPEVAMVALESDLYLNGV